MVITAFGYSLSILGYSLTRIVYPNTNLPATTYVAEQKARHNDNI
jgi:hypothetical protein